MEEVEPWCFYDTYLQELIDFTLLLHMSHVFVMLTR